MILVGQKKNRLSNMLKKEETFHLQNLNLLVIP